jgi:type IV secretory pathway VirD2 relaxase
MKNENPPDRDGDGPDRDREFRPKIGSRRSVDRERAPTFRALMARAMRKYARRVSEARRARPQLGRVAVREPRANSRRCVIKASFVPMTAAGRKAAKLHLAYLERDGVERDGSRGRLYGADDAFRAEEFKSPLESEPRQFRFIVSPEDGDQLDLTAFTRQFISQVEKDTGRRLIWAAVNHHNTDNSHVHVVIRGVDRDGDEVRIDGRYLGQEMRWRAQEIATRELGPRLELDLARARTAEIERDRFTDIDRMLAAHASPDGTVTVQTLLAAPGPEARACLGRLPVLETMQLARKESAGGWSLADGWKEALERMGERHDMIDHLRPLVGLQAIRYQILDQNNPTPPFEGVVVGKGLDDELRGQMFAAVTTAAGDAYYVRLPSGVAESVREGDTVRLGFEVESWLKKSDKIIDRFARENGGIYDPARHQRALEILPRPSQAVGERAPADRVAANILRLERLARYRLAARLPDGRWQVAPDLIAQLQDRERSHPQHRFRIERVGPAAPELPRGPETVAAERAALGHALAKQLGLTFVSDPSEFRGRVLACPPAPSGREYVRVVDEARRQFVLVPKPPEAERLLGRRVEISRDRDQGLSLHLSPELSR